MGGALTLSTLERYDSFSSGCCFYGIPTELKVEKIYTPIQLHFGILDESIGFSDINVLNTNF